MDPKFILYLERKKLYQASICTDSFNFRVTLIEYFFDKTNRRWIKSEDSINLPLYIWPALLEYTPTLDQFWSAVEDNSICVYSKLGILIIY